MVEQTSLDLDMALPHLKALIKMAPNPGTHPRLYLKYSSKLHHKVAKFIESELEFA